MLQHQRLKKPTPSLIRSDRSSASFKKIKDQDDEFYTIPRKSQSCPRIRIFRLRHVRLLADRDQCGSGSDSRQAIGLGIGVGVGLADLDTAFLLGESSANLLFVARIKARNHSLESVKT